MTDVGRAANLWVRNLIECYLQGRFSSNYLPLPKLGSGAQLLVSSGCSVFRLRCEDSLSIGVKIIGILKA